MGDFEADTAVTGEAGHFTATLSPDWEVWGPLGGYVAAVALRALGAASALPRPASFQCLFLSIARFAEVELEVETLRRGKRSEALRLSMTQEGRPVLSASGWFVDRDLSGLVHDAATMPDVPPADEVAPYSEIADDYDSFPRVWRTIDGRPVTWSEGPRRPVWHAWLRLLDTPPLDDAVLEAARNVMWLDIMMWNAACAPHLPWPVSHLAPNLDLHAVFHDAAPTDEWLLCDSHAPVARNGLIGCNGRVWAPSGRLLASGTSNLMCRPAPDTGEPSRREP